ncbi:hypothetical protein T06_9482 [Trichinella sp. T6]|nr:hypothetical protein T06_9482 [Trichinella sp. T6]
MKSTHWAHAGYLFDTLKESTTMYNGNYSDHLRNYSVLQNSFMLRASNFVSIKGFILIRNTPLQLWNKWVLKLTYRLFNAYGSHPSETVFYGMQNLPFSAHDTLWSSNLSIYLLN